MVTGAYWPEISGGGLQCRTMIRALKDRWRFQVWTTATDPSLPAESVVDDVPVTRVHVDVRRAFTKIAAGFAAIRFFIAQRHSFSVVHLHGFSQKSMVMVLLARMFGKKVVITVHTAGQDEPDAVRRLGAPALSTPNASIRYQRMTGFAPSCRSACCRLACRGCCS